METPSLGSRSLEVLDGLRGALARGDYPAGSRLPSERALAERLGVSRPTIRRAVAQLVQEGHIRTRHGSGMTVCGPRLENKRRAMISVMSVFDDDRLNRLQETVLRRGFMLCAFSVMEQSFDPEVERLFLERVRAEKHHALIAFCSPIEPVNTDALEALAADGTRVIHVEPFRLTRPDQEYLLPDYEAAGRMAGERLKSLDCSSLVYVRMNESPYEMLMERGLRKIRKRIKVFICPPNFEQCGPAREKVATFLKGLPARAGIFCRTLGLAREMQDLVMQHAPSKGLRFLGMSSAGAVKGCPVEQVAFDGEAILEQAVEHVARPEIPVIREMIEPVLVQGGPIP